MIKTQLQLFFAIALLCGFTACGKKETPEPSVEAEATKTEIVVAEVKEDIQEIADKAQAEAKEVMDSVKTATAENLEIAQEKLVEIKADAAEQMDKVIEAADEQLDQAGTALKAVKDDAVQSLNNMLKAEEE
jgi:predicted small lipoprotein YifL